MNRQVETRLKQLEKSGEMASAAADLPTGAGGLPLQADDPEAAHLGLIDHIRRLQVRAVEILDRAERCGRAETALRSIREARSTLELLARLTGQLDSRAASLRVQAIILMPGQLNATSECKPIEISET